MEGARHVVTGFEVSSPPQTSSACDHVPSYSSRTMSALYLVLSVSRKGLDGS